MIIDARNFEGHVIKSDICIVGGGAAGITLAKELSGSALSVCLLESGGFTADENTQSLYQGETDVNVQSYSENYLARSRLRYFGGSTNHWRGWCRPLDPIDFEKRDWIPYSGWPITRNELDPFYHRAAEYLQIQPFDRERDEGVGLGEDEAVINNDIISTKQFHFSPPTRFGAVYRDALSRAPDVTVVIYANVTRIGLDASGVRVNDLSVSTLNGTSFRAEAKLYVLATGGVEVPRLMLASNDVQRSGVGNQNDLVGRFFMDHPHMRRCGELVLTRPIRNIDAYDRQLVDTRPGRRLSVMCPTEMVLRKYRMPNVSAQIEVFIKKVKDVETAGQAFYHMDHDLFRNVRRDPAPRFYSGQFYLRGEQLPEPANRVTLDSQKDALGMPRARLKWHLGKQDSAHFIKVMELIGREIARHSSGRARLLISREQPWLGVYGGAHHIGTTRMSGAPRDGVVDPDCRVHGISNLFIAGSAVFPTSGFANPTLTIVALALRLGDHLHRELGNA